MRTLQQSELVETIKIIFKQELHPVINRLDRLEGKVDRLDTKVNQLDGKVSELDEKVNQLDGKVSKLDEKVNRLDGKVSELDEKVNQLDEKVIKLDEKVNRMDGKLESTIKHVVLNSEQISILQHGVQEIQGTVMRIEKTQERYEVAIDLLAGR